MNDQNQNILNDYEETKNDKCYEEIIQDSSNQNSDIREPIYFGVERHKSMGDI